MARTTTDTATTTEQTVTFTGGDIEEIYAENLGAEDLLVNVPMVTGDDFDTIGPGKVEYYRRSSGSKTKVDVLKYKTTANTTSMQAGVTKGSA